MLLMVLVGCWWCLWFFVFFLFVFIINKVSNYLLVNVLLYLELRFSVVEVIRLIILMIGKIGLKIFFDIKVEFIGMLYMSVGEMYL